jgi:hypothetical protein
MFFISIIGILQRMMAILACSLRTVMLKEKQITK